MRISKPTGLTLALLVTLAAGAPAALLAVEEIAFTASDGVSLYADVHTVAAGPTAPLVLLFHQAGGDARGEYQSIVPRLLEAGYNVLAVDLRSGGSRFGGVNRTVAGLEGREFGYCDAYPDLEAALEEAERLGFSGPRVAWGSSYSAALALRLGANHGEELDAVLAFSPASGGPMAACKAAPLIPQLTVPALALRPASEMERESSRQQFVLFEEHGVRTHVAPSGVHGSSMLDRGRVGADTAATWDVVLGFLAEATSGALEIDASIWNVISATVAANDLTGMAATYHEDAVLVSSKGTVAIAEQLVKWGGGMERIGAEGRSAGVSFRFSARQDDQATAFERGIFRYSETDADGVEQPVFIPFEALLVKKGGRWLIVMERQLEATSEGAWDALD